MGLLRKNSIAVVLMLLFIIGVSGCGKKKPPKFVPEDVETGTEQKWDDSIAFEDRRYEATDELETIYFGYDRSKLVTDTKEILEKNADWLKDNPNEWILIEGHCDERGTEEYNIALGERRTESVKKYYKALGIDSTRIETLSWGEEKPVDTRNSEVAWSKNRRAETLRRVK